MLDTWPISALWPQSVRWSPLYVSKSGGVSLNGDESLVVSDGGGRWACEMTVPLAGGYIDRVQQIKAARAMIEGTIGGSVPVIVPYIATAEAPWPLGAPLDPVPFSDGSTFSDGSEFSSGGITITAAAAALRATQLTIAATVAAPLIGGECFSIDHPTQGKRLYPITRVSGSVISLGRPLREAITDGTVLDFVTPGCVMKLKNYQDAMAAITAPWVSSLTLQFQESAVDG